jgi:hypothetical protein
MVRGRTWTPRRRMMTMTIAPRRAIVLAARYPTICQKRGDEDVGKESCAESIR